MARDDLGTPRGTPGGPQVDPDAVAAAAERIARFLGTGRYLAIQTIVVVVWILVNITVAVLRWDPYPFILLNLAFSTQAAYAAPLILLAQNRQDDRDREQLERDRAMNARSLADTEFLAREIASVRLSLDHKIDRDDLADLGPRIDELLQRMERIERAVRPGGDVAPPSAPDGDAAEASRRSVD